MSKELETVKLFTDELRDCADSLDYDAKRSSCSSAGMSPKTLMIISVGVIMVAGFISYKVAVKRRRKEIKEWKGAVEEIPDDMTVQEWFMGRKTWMPSPKSFAIGMASGVVFGFIDNFGLFYGMSALDGLIKNHAPGGRYENLMAGWGNTYSDGVGAFLGTFAGKIITDGSYVMGWTTEDDENYPIVAEAVGIILGCMLGMAVPYLMMRGNKDKFGRICGLGQYVCPPKK